MLATYVPDLRTPLPLEYADATLAGALEKAMLATPSIPVRALALAKTVLECGRDVAAGLVWTSSHRYCIGNIKAGLKYSGMYTTFPCNEIINGKTVWFSPDGRLSGRGGKVVAEPYENPPGHPQCRFRAYAGPTDGAYQYIDFVATGRYVDAWQELLQGDAHGYVMALARKGYFTANPDSYARSVISLQREYIRWLESAEVPSSPTPEPEVVRSWLSPQPFNAAEVIAMERLLDQARDWTRDSRDQQMAIDQDPDLRDTEPDPEELKS